MSFNGTKTPLKPTGVAKWQVPKRKTENGVMAYCLEGEIKELFIKNFPIHSNRRIMQWFGLSHSTTQRFARGLGLKFTRSMRVTSRGHARRMAIMPVSVAKPCRRAHS